MRDTCIRGFGPVGTNGNLYAEREVDSPELMPHYLRHVDRMTIEGLHAKSAIAAELAFRDAKIAALEARVRELEADARRWQAYERELPKSAQTVRQFLDAAIDATNTGKEDGEHGNG